MTIYTYETAPDAWAVEREENFRGPVLWAGSDNWTQNIDEAVRFSSFDEAEDAAASVSEAFPRSQGASAIHLSQFASVVEPLLREKAEAGK